MPFVIDSFRGSYAFLSNFCRSLFVLDEMRYDNVEQFFQSAKTLNSIEASSIRCASASEARKLGQRCQLRADWESIKLDVMLRGVQAKFTQNSDFADLLRKTRDAILIEGNTYHDVFWGKCFCLRHGGDGDNMLGRILVQVRGELFSDLPT